VGVGSRKIYSQFLDQLNTTNNETIVSVLNNLLTTSPESILLPQAFSLTENDKQKIKTAREQIILSLKIDGPVFDLKNDEQSIKFIVLSN
jgi:hypothetical protein